MPQDFPFEINGLPVGGTPPPTPSPGTPTPTPSATATPSPCGVNTFSNPAAITIPDSGPGTPYPSNIPVAGLTGTVTKVTVRLNNLTHTFPADIDILLVGPGGQNAIIMSDVGGGAPGASNVTFTLDDAAGAPIPATNFPSGTFKPTNTGTGDTWPAPAPAPAGGSPLSVFNGGNPNGTWALYLVDDAAADLGTFAGGWTLNISTTTGTCGTPTPSPTTTVTPTIPPSATPTIPPSATPTASPTVPPGTPSPSPTATVGGSPSATPGISPSTQAVNLSTRMRVQTGDRVGIGGFIITGGPKQVLVRAIGPSLTRYMIVDVLADPFLELHGPAGFTTLTNDNWRVPNGAAIQATGLPPTNDLESAILVRLNPGAYTAIVKGNGGTSGVALVEVYDLDPSSGNLANISTRAFVDTADNIVIAGFILADSSANGASVPDSLIIRGIGPTLTAAGVSSVLANPTLELRDHNGTLLISNNDWQDNPAQAAEITASGLAPSNNLESAIAATLPPGLYTALLAGLNNTTGNGLVEVYDRGAGGGTPGPSATPTPPGPSPSTTPGGTPIPSPTTTPGGPTPTPSPPPASPTPSPTTCTENFDGVAAPALPAGWTAVLLSGDPPSWETTTTTPDSAPNAAFVVDQDGISEKDLFSRNITISSAASVLSFRNMFDTEFDGTTYWDGFVLEVSTDGGATYQDIIAAGGTFTAGPYTGEIDGTAMNPLAGRMAWSGSSGGYIDTTINLPASLNGQTIKLQFRMGTDEATAGPGAWVDGLTITGASCP